MRNIWKNGDSIRKKKKKTETKIKTNLKTMFYFDSTREIRDLISRALSSSYTSTLTTRFHTRRMVRKKKIVPKKFSKTKEEFLCGKGHKPEKRMKSSTLKYVGTNFVEDMIINKDTPMESTKKSTKLI